ncbi:hypothetical protein BBF96_06565 [Anoxybacter fermentans]|uniref:ABC transmembrane type-1 domain-containing protein n=1 Tax=Anoxybacter fermentans TaxID=1323375 RepID=A0A3Q9HQC7_9FIRM|nr:ABC transporter transmembrane domain-containing protein [Anoxybacter fermentans]AZR73076.1 hypothetical protein BBF96_06565 [Anoxybacter fermentans]
MEIASYCSYTVTCYNLYRKKIGNLLTKEVSKYQKELSTLNTKAKDIFDYILNIKSFNAEDFFNRRYNEQESKVLKHQFKANLYSKIIWIIGIINYNFIYVLFYSIGGFLAYKGFIDFGLVVGLYLMIDRLVNLLMGIPRMFSSLFEVVPKINRFYEILDLPESQEIKTFEEKIDESDVVIQLKNFNYFYQSGKKF